jgi:hypothetical protein
LFSTTVRWARCRNMGGNTRNREHSMLTLEED